MNRRHFITVASVGSLMLGGCTTTAAEPSDNNSAVCGGFVRFLPSPTSGRATPELIAALRRLGAEYAGGACAEIIGAREDGSIDLTVAQAFVAHINAEYESALGFERGPYLILSRTDLSRRLSADEQAIVLPLPAQSPEEAARLIEVVIGEIRASRRRGESVNRPCPSWVQALYVVGISPQYIGHQCRPGS